MSCFRWLLPAFCWALLRRSPLGGCLRKSTAIALTAIANSLLWLARISPQGWGILFGLALVSHVGGQRLIAYGLAHLSASLGSVSLLVQPVCAALFAWLLLGEAIGPLQIAGGCAVLVGIRLAHRASSGGA